MITVELSPIDSLEPYLPAWLDLARNSCEANAFFEPWCFIPAWRHLATSEERLLLVFAREAAGTLIGFFPLSPVATYRRMPLRHYGIWRHLHCFLAAPLLRRGHETEALTGLFEWADQFGRGFGGIEFPCVYEDGAFLKALHEFGEKTSRLFDPFASFDRAVLIPSGTAEQYLERAIKKKHRKDLERKMEQLSQLGPVRLHVLDRAEAAPDWTALFLKLEQGGWKGESGTSLADRPNERRFFEELMSRGVEARALIREMMTVGDEPVCARVAFHSADMALSFKIAYNERLARYSPGMLLEIANLRWAFEQSPPVAMDSCAAPGSEMFKRLWLDKRTIASAMVSKQNPNARAIMRTLIAVSTGGRRIKRALCRAQPADS